MQLPSLLRLLHHAGRGFLVLLLLPQLLHRAGQGLLLELPWQLLSCEGEACWRACCCAAPSEVCRRAWCCCCRRRSWAAPGEASCCYC